MGPELIAALVASFAAVGSVIYAAVSISNSNKNEKEHFKYNHSQKIENWYKETLLILKELFYNHVDNKNSKEKNTLLAKLSTNIDIGRGFFKNVNKTDENDNKPELFKGKRVLPIGLLVMYHHIFKQGLQKENELALRNLERAWISEVTLYTEKIQKSDKIVPYTLTDNANILEVENLKNETFAQVFAGQDIVKYVKLSNEMLEKSISKVDIEIQPLPKNVIEIKKPVTPRTYKKSLQEYFTEKAQEKAQQQEEENDNGFELKK